MTVIDTLNSTLSTLEIRRKTAYDEEYAKNIAAHKQELDEFTASKQSELDAAKKLLDDELNEKKTALDAAFNDDIATEKERIDQLSVSAANEAVATLDDLIDFTKSNISKLTK
jgi:phage host-nuclease inhibitor protein Gam